MCELHNLLENSCYIESEVVVRSGKFKIPSQHVIPGFSFFSPTISVPWAQRLCNLLEPPVTGGDWNLKYKVSAPIMNCDLYDSNGQVYLLSSLKCTYPAVNHCRSSTIFASRIWKTFFMASKIDARPILILHLKLLMCWASCDFYFVIDFCIHENPKSVHKRCIHLGAWC